VYRHLTADLTTVVHSYKLLINDVKSHSLTYPYQVKEIIYRLTNEIFRLTELCLVLKYLNSLWLYIILSMFDISLISFLKWS